MNLSDKLGAYEKGELSDEETLRLFQELVDTGHLWRLGENYARAAALLVEAGLIKPAEEGEEAV
jgi:hypothetical protein